MEGDEESLQLSKKRLQDTATGSVGSPFENTILESINITEAKIGHLLLTFVVTQKISGQNGNWPVGAIASLVDAVACFVVSTITGRPTMTVDFTISYFSSARIHEEVEIDAKVEGQNGKLFSAVVEIRRRDDGRRVALGKLWLTAVGKARTNDTTSKSTLPSKL